MEEAGKNALSTQNQVYCKELWEGGSDSSYTSSF